MNTIQVTTPCGVVEGFQEDGVNCFLGIPYAAGVSLSLHHCIIGEELGEFTEQFAPVVPSHGCVVVRARIVEK